MNRDFKLEDRHKVETIVDSGHIANAAEVLRADPQRIEREEQFKDLIKAKISKGLNDIADGHIVSQEEFLAQIKGRSFRKTMTELEDGDA